MVKPNIVELHRQLLSTGLDIMRGMQCCRVLSREEIDTLTMTKDWLPVGPGTISDLLLSLLYYGKLFGVHIFVKKEER
jgi:hypothetical protein